jgi:rhamnosyltransferase
VGVESEVAENSFPEIAVLFATHKPTSVIKEQIDSIYSQELVKVKVYWGDDRSNEETKTYIRSLLAGKNYVEISDTGIGATKNFLHLLRFPTEEYIAFSDQDDIWLPRKLAQHVELLKNSNDIPSLSHSKSVIFTHGDISEKSSVCNNHTFLKLSWQNCVQGCTTMINAKAKAQLNSMPQEHVVSHDWWAALVISLTGEILFNLNTDTLYRIHDTNSIGIPGNLSRIRNSISRSNGYHSRQFLEVLNFLSSQNNTKIEEVEFLRDYWNQISNRNTFKRLCVALTDSNNRISGLEDIWRRLRLIFGAP